MYISLSGVSGLLVLRTGYCLVLVDSAVVRISAVTSSGLGVERIYVAYCIEAGIILV